jgi:hypothetical protein
MGTHLKRRGMKAYAALGCSQLNVVVSNLSIALQQATAAGLDATDPDFSAAQDFYNSESGWFSSGSLPNQWFDSSSTCNQYVTQGNQLYANLNAKITSAGGTPPTAAPPAPPDPNSSLLSNVLPSIPSWVLPVGAGIVGLGLIAYLFGPLIRRIGKKAPLPGGSA